MNYSLSLMLLCSSFLYTSTVLATIIPLDFNNFFSIADPNEVNISLDGQAVIFSESIFLTPLVLINDPGLGDENIIAPAINRSLVFDFNFAEGVFDNDGFGAYLFDSDLGEFAGLEDSFEIDSSNFGTFSFDLSNLLGKALGLSFVLSEFDYANTNVGSMLTISSLRLVDNYSAVNKTPIPEPSSDLLILVGIVGLLKVRKTK